MPRPGLCISLDTYSGYLNATYTKFHTWARKILLSRLEHITDELWSGLELGANQSSSRK